MRAQLDLITDNTDGLKSVQLDLITDNTDELERVLLDLIKDNTDGLKKEPSQFYTDVLGKVQLD